MADFVLVPGAGGAAWYWHRLVPELRRRGHDAVAVDLPADDDTVGLSGYANLVVAAATGRRDVVLVAQSMGGLSAPLACDRVPVRLLVLLNAMIPRPGETGGDWWVNTGQARAQRQAAERAGRLRPGDPDEDVEALFLHDVPSDVVAAGEPPREQSGRPFADHWPLAAWPDVPTRVIATRDDRLFPPEFQRRVAADRLGLTTDELDGGHLVALSRPVALADRLESYLA